MPAETILEGQAERDAKAVERLVLFTDAVVAIIITLMVLEVKPPALPHHATDRQLLDELAHSWPKFLAVLVSFLVIGLFWTMHHRHFNWVRRVTGRVVWLNLLYLLALATIPYATAVLAEHPGRTGTILYASTLAVVSCISALLWWALSRDPDIVPHEPARHAMQVGTATSLAAAAIFASSIGIAMIGTTLARCFWILVLFSHLLVHRIDRRRASKPTPATPGPKPDA